MAKADRDRRTELGLFMEILQKGDGLVEQAENLLGKNGCLVEGIEPGGFRMTCDCVMARNGLVIAWLGVGMGRKQYSGDPVWGQPDDEVLPAIRFNLANTEQPWLTAHQCPVSETMMTFFPPSEPNAYRILFRKTTEGLRFVACERFLDDGAVWQECDLDSSLLLIEGLESVLPRLMQHGE